MKNDIDIHPYQLSVEDPRFRITPTQQMAAACSGALITSLIGKYSNYCWLILKLRNFKFI